jgi:hypothetical protein
MDITIDLKAKNRRQVVLKQTNLIEFLSSLVAEKS